MKKKEKKKGKVLRIIIGGMVLVIGILLMGYPLLAELVFKYRQDSLIETYMDDSANLPDEEAERELDRARKYNDALYRNHVKFGTDTENDYKEDSYESLLNIQNSGIMGYIMIPCIDVELPIYHGISETVLENGIGHLEGSSLPIGGENTHSVLTGHTGINRARLFTDLTQMDIGDQFYIYILNQKIAYEVDQIDVVLPEEVEKLEIEKGRDECTLVTCTPYGVNSHRLLVRGHRVEYKEESVAAEAEKQEKGQSDWLKKYEKAAVIGIAVILVIVLGDKLIRKGQSKMRKKKESKGEDNIG